MRSPQGIMALAPRYAEGGDVKPQTLQEKARIRRIMQELAMDGEAPDKRPDNQPDIRMINGEWVVMVGGKPRKPLGMAEGGRTPEEIQKSLRGEFVIPPPEGYIPGFNPEMQYFQNDPENPVIPPYRAPWDNSLYAGSPINRFNPAGAPYFQSIIPGAQPTGPRGGARPGGGITGLGPSRGGTPGWPTNQGGGRGTQGPAPSGPDAAGMGPDPGMGRSSGMTRDPAGMGFGKPWGGFGQPSGGRQGGFNSFGQQSRPSWQMGNARDPGKLEQWLVEHPRLAGAIAGGITGVPGMGLAARKAVDQYWANNAWQSPAPPDPNYVSGAQQLVNNIDDQNPGSDRSLRALAGGNQSPIEQGRQYYGQMGSWTGFDTGSGREWEYRYTGPLSGAGGSGGSGVNTSPWWLSHNFDGGKVVARTPTGPVEMAAGGIADMMPPEMRQQAPQQPNEQDIQMVAAAITGEAGDQADAIINMFIEKYGNEAFLAVRQMILESVAPNAQTEGMVQGPGGGMDDQVMGMIGNQQPVAVSPGEYIVPADVVSGLGSGSSDAGAQELDRMADNVRMARHGGRMQPPPVDPKKVMPA